MNILFSLSLTENHLRYFGGILLSYTHHNKLNYKLSFWISLSVILDPFILIFFNWVFHKPKCSIPFSHNSNWTWLNHRAVADAITLRHVTNHFIVTQYNLVTHQHTFLSAWPPVLMLPFEGGFQLFWITHSGKILKMTNWCYIKPV